MPKFYQKIAGQIAPVNYSEEQLAELKEAGAKLETLDESSKEVKAYKAELAKRQAEAAKVKSVTMRQARLALLGAGLLGKVSDALAKLESPLKEAASIEWEYSSEVKRDGALVQQLGAALGLDDAALDALFTKAATL
jgi:ribosomal 50S subunit-associated protein YjgA (DUF615 family)